MAGWFNNGDWSGLSFDDNIAFILSDYAKALSERYIAEQRLNPFYTFAGVSIGPVPEPSAFTAVYYWKQPFGTEIAEPITDYMQQIYDYMQNLVIRPFNSGFVTPTPLEPGTHWFNPATDVDYYGLDDLLADKGLEAGPGVHTFLLGGFHWPRDNIDVWIWFKDVINSFIDLRWHNPNTSLHWPEPVTQGWSKWGSVAVEITPQSPDILSAAIAHEDSLSQNEFQPGFLNPQLLGDATYLSWEGFASNTWWRNASTISERTVGRIGGTTGQHGEIFNGAAVNFNYSVVLKKWLALSGDPLIFLKAPAIGRFLVRVNESPQQEVVISGTEPIDGEEITLDFFNVQIGQETMRPHEIFIETSSDTDDFHAGKWSPVGAGGITIRLETLKYFISANYLAPPNFVYR